MCRQTKLMTPNEQIISDIHTNTDALLQVLLEFPSDQFTRKPSDNAWSAAELAEHLLLIERSVTKALAGKALPTERPYDQKLELLKPAMADRERKFVVPELAKPIAVSHNRQEMIAEIKQQRQEQTALIPSLEMSETCMDFKHPMMGALTRYEWVYFNIYHTERHLHQLREIREVVQ